MRSWSHDDIKTLDPVKGREDIARITVACAEQLQGHHPGVQGGALADLVATWLAGHSPEDSREKVLAEWLKAVRLLVPVNAAMIELQK